MPSRREVLLAMLGAPFVARSVLGCRCDAEPAREIGGSLLGPRIELGHRLRDVSPEAFGAWDRAPLTTGSVAVVGGGPAGLAAAWRLGQRGQTDTIVVDMESRAGGKAISEGDAAIPHPWGAHYIPVPMPHNQPLIELLTAVGAVAGEDAHGTPVGAEEVLVRDPAERLFFRGYWHEGLYPAAGASAKDLAELGRFRELVTNMARTTGSGGRRLFAIPLEAGSAASDGSDLDGLTAAEWMERERFTSERLRWLLDYACRDDYGMSLESTSAFAALWYHAARIPAHGSDSMPLLTWPDGNGPLVRHMAASVGDRLWTDHLAVRVTQDDDGVELCLFDNRSRSQKRLRVQHLVIATPRFVAERLVEDLPSGEAPSFGSWIVANLHLSDRPKERGFGPAWDNVLYDSASLGYVTATHQRGRDFGPTVWTYYRPLTDRDPRQSRAALLEARYEDLRDGVLADLSRAHSDLARHVSRVDIFRWGHAMVQPRPGFLAKARQRARQLGRIHFAHSDQSGIALFEEAFHHGVRAADAVVTSLTGEADAGEARL